MQKSLIWALCILGLYVTELHAQEVTPVQDSTVVDTVRKNTRQVLLDSLKANSDIRSAVTYKAQDSIVFDLDVQRLFLYNTGEISYEDIDLKSHEITVNYEEQLLYAKGTLDSAGKPLGTPVFSQGEQSYNAREMSYNFKSKKGRILGAKTQQGQELILSDTTKRLPDGTLFSKNAKITSCDDEHPHYYVTSNKIKVLPNSKFVRMVSGPLRLVIEDFPIPLIIPFGVIPNIKDGRQSGILRPTIGEARDRGFFLRGLGYYFALDDNWDLEFLGDIFTKGGWKVEAASNYNKRYKYSGRFGLSYGLVKFGESTNGIADPNFSKSNEWRLQWSHRQTIDPTLTISANADITSSQRFTQRLSLNANDFFQNNLASSLNFSKRFNNLPFQINMNFSHRQDLQKKTVDMTLPSLTISMNRLTPFKNISGKSLRWLSNLGINYNSQFTNQLSQIRDSLFLKALFNPKEYADNYTQGVRHQFSTSTTLKLLKFINLTGSLNFNEYWYLETLNRTYIADSNKVQDNTLRGFSAARDYSASIGASTNIFGIFQLTQSKREVTFRQRLSPFVSYNLKPDFSDERFGYYRSVQVDTLGRTQLYNRFRDGIFGSPTAVESQSIGFGLGSVLEMKYRKKASFDPDFNEKEDKFQRVTLLNNLSLSGAYNFAVDSFQLSPLSLNGRISLFKNNLNINANATLDPYDFKVSENGTETRLNAFLWDTDRKLFRLTNPQINLSTGFAASSQKKKKEGSDKDEQTQPVRKKPGNTVYAPFDVPWDVDVDYTLGITQVRRSATETVTKIASTVSLNGRVAFTSKWDLGLQTGYDLVLNELTYTSINITRDLHCWQMSLEWRPFGPLQSYFFTLNVKSSTLQDVLRIRKVNQFQDRSGF